MIQPKHLLPGDTIAITATARKISRAELQPALEWIESQGWKWELAPQLEAVDHQFAGTDEERAAALQWCLDHPFAKAIWCARGGYGTARILDSLNWNSFVSDPKWVVGYSDITALHGEVQRKGIRSIHATMPISVSSNSKEAMSTLHAALTGTPTTYTVDRHTLNQQGKASGKLIGGNLSVLYSTLGSTSQPPLKGNILFLEDLDEYLYHIDRMMLNLSRNGWWNEVAGVVVGGMTDMNDNTVPFGETAEEIIARHLSTYPIPVAFGFPVGHLEDNRALPLGSDVQFNVDSQTAQLIF